MSGPAPFGTRRVDGTLVPVLADQGVVRELVEAFIASGGRSQATAGALNSKGYTTRRGVAWSGTAVSRVIQNPALSELVPDDLWRRCEPLLEDRRAHAEQLIAILDVVFAEKTLDDWQSRLDQHGITFGVVARAEELPDDPQLRAHRALPSIVSARRPGPEKSRSPVPRTMGRRWATGRSSGIPTGIPSRFPTARKLH